MSFDLNKLLRDVFEPTPGEKVVVMVDLPHDKIIDQPDWADRRLMANEWRIAFKEFDTHVAPLVAYAATGSSNSNLPEHCIMEGQTKRLADVLSGANLVVAMTQFSATAPLFEYVHKIPTFRAASMPNVLRRMEHSALAADYPQIARRTHAIAERLTRAVEAEIVFSTDHRCTFDLRYRTGFADDGVCTANKVGHKLINLPSGEGFIVPYEGERPGEPSRTNGVIPLKHWNTTLLLHVEGNRITTIEGDKGEADRIRAYFDVDPACRNVAELGFGCNDQAVVTGNVLEDEKAGLHWAHGRSEHLGGTVGPSAFRDPTHVVHHDIVYARGCPIGTKQATLKYPDGTEEVLMKDNQYCIF